MNTYQTVHNSLVCGIVEDLFVQKYPELASKDFRMKMSPEQKEQLVRAMFDAAIKMGAVPIEGVEVVKVYD
jgi:hypothetical protein